MLQENTFLKLQSYFKTAKLQIVIVIQEEK